jgi:tetratricopeptide (TPR) repeat protein
MIGTLVFFIGCGSAAKKTVDTNPPPNPQALADFNRGLQFLETEDYDEASRVFEAILVRNPVSEFELVTMFNAGAAREGLHDCKGAADRYRKVIAASSKIAPQLHSQGLYRLSYAYECLGNDAKVIASLLEVRNHVNSLTEDILQAELPARLAAAYARVGNNKTAKFYYDQANKGLALLKVSYRQRAKYDELVARILFLMGRINQPDEHAKDKPKAYLENIRLLQSYLYQSIELEVPVWSEKSLKQLVNSYEQLWSYVDEINAASSDPLVKENLERKMRLQIARDADKALLELKSYQTSEGKSGGLVSKLSFVVAKQEQRFRQLVAANAETTLQSKESRDREGIKRKGRLQNSP